MKTITGTVNSSKPISLSKASSILKGFISKETGASHAVSAFLKRSSDSFNELVQFHKELKSKSSEKKKKKKNKRFDFEEDEDVKSKRGKKRKSEEKEGDGHGRKKKSKKRRHVEEEEAEQ